MADRPAKAEASFSAHIIASEITQGIQDDQQTVPLLAGKSAILRIYFSYAGTRVLTNWTGTIAISDPATGETQDLNSIRPVPVSLDPAMNGDLPAQRTSLSAGLTFKIPGSWTARGAIEVGHLQTFGGANSLPVGCDNCGAWSQKLTFAASPVLSVVLVGLRYTYNGTLYQPRDIDYKYAASYLRRAYPASAVDVQTRVIDWNPTPIFVGAAPTFTCSTANSLLSQLRTLDESAGGNPLAHYYGMVFDGGDTPDAALLWMRGCASVPSSPDASAIGSGPTGINQPRGWSRLPTYGDWYAAHELGHTFGRTHVGTSCNDAPADAGYPYVSPNRGEIADSQHHFIGFDIGDDDLAISPTILAGGKTFDAMTYCNPEWLSDYTYLGILARIRAEKNNLSSGSSAAVAGAPPQAVVLESGATPATAALASDGMGDTKFSYIVIGGKINFTKDAATIESIDPVSSQATFANAIANPDDFVVKGLDNGGATVVTQPATIFRDTDIPAGKDDTGLLKATIPYSASISRIVVEHQGKAVASIDAGTSGFVVSKPDATLPNFSVASKDIGLISQNAYLQQKGIGRFSREDGNIVYSWDTSSVPAGQEVAFNAQISTDGGSWRTIAVNLQKSRLVIDPSWIGKARTLKVRIIGKSGAQSSFATSDELAIYAGSDSQQ